jgi:transcription elongation factor Elf1
MQGGDVFVCRWNHSVTTPPSKFHEYLVKFGVEGIEQKGRKFVFRCPICGDSATIKSKRRGFLISNMDGNGAMGCHNCGYKSSFSNFLKHERIELYNQWIQDVFVGMSLDDKVEKELAEYVQVALDEEVVDYSLFKPLAKSSPSIIYRKAMEFVCSRKIPKKFARHFLYCEEGRYANRIIIPHYNKDMTYKHFEARDLRSNPWVKYLYPDNWKPNNYNLPNIDLGIPYFAFEGVIDSQFLDNSGACGGAQKYDYFFEQIHRSLHRNGIMFADGDEDGIRATFKFLKKGFKAFKWTAEMLKYGVHDLNGLVQVGYFKDDEFNEDGTVKTEVILKHVIEPSIGEILCFQMEALQLGVNVLERKKNVGFVRSESQIDRFTW